MGEYTDVGFSRMSLTRGNALPIHYRQVNQECSS